MNKNSKQTQTSVDALDEVAKKFGLSLLGAKHRERGLAASVAHAVSTLREDAVIDPAVHRIQFMDASELVTLQNILEHGNTFGWWHTPDKWAGGKQASVQDIDLRERIIAYLGSRHQAMVRDADGALTRSHQEAGVDGHRMFSTAAARVRAIIDGAVGTATRYLLLCRMGPSGMNTAKGRSLDTTTLSQLGYQYLPLLLSVAVGKRLDMAPVDADGPTVNPPAMTCYLALIEAKDLEGLSETVRERLEAEVRRARMLADMGLWSDVPTWSVPFEQVTAVKGIAQGGRAQPRRLHKHLPLPDDYVAEMGRKSLWIIQELGPNLLVIAEKILDIWQNTAELDMSMTRIEARRTSMLMKYLEDFSFRDSQGIELAPSPFELRLSLVGKGRRAVKTEDDLEATIDSGEDDDEKVDEHAGPLELLQWPPRNFAHILGLMGVLQGAHLFVVTMSLAPRKTELLSLQRDCIHRALDGMPFACGRTFKLVERHEGELRDWVLPSAATSAIEQQVRLASLIELIGPQNPSCKADSKPVPSEPRTHLWVQTGHSRSDRTKPLLRVGHALMSYARTLGMSVRPGGQKLRVHRFRKTVARLAGLALTDAPMILMQVFGHKSIEMTLYYILTDPDLQVEVEQVRRELKIMRGVEVVESMVADAIAEASQEAQEAIFKAKGDPTADASQSALPRLAHAGYGGPAAPKLFGAVKEQVVTVHRTGKEWGASDSYETAYFLTEAGLTFTMPRDGVFCTKAFTQPAACTGKRGKTDPGNCQSDCGHRLELAARRAQLDASLIKQVALYEEALREGHELLRAGLAKKICDALKPFNDIREKWMQHATVRELVDAARVAS